MDIQKTMNVGEVIDVICPGTPFPNTGFSLAGINFNFPLGAPASAVTQNFNGNSFQIKVTAFPTVNPIVATVNTKNSMNQPFTDTITITVINPLPLATGSGITVSEPYLPA